MICISSNNLLNFRAFGSQNMEPPCSKNQQTTGKRLNTWFHSYLLVNYSFPYWQPLITVYVFSGSSSDYGETLLPLLAVMQDLVDSNSLAPPLVLVSWFLSFSVYVINCSTENPRHWKKIQWLRWDSNPRPLGYFGLPKPLDFFQWLGFTVLQLIIWYCLGVIQIQRIYDTANRGWKKSGFSRIFAHVLCDTSANFRLLSYWASLIMWPGHICN